VFSKRERDDVILRFSAIGGESVQLNLIGYSYGGLQAAQAAADYVENGGRVDHLVLIGTPISTELLNKLKANSNIGNIEVIDLTGQGDPIRAGMGTGELIRSFPELAAEFT
jgi:pimeloyl-ACP methyl ester carboxylesterase